MLLPLQINEEKDLSAAGCGLIDRLTTPFAEAMILLLMLLAGGVLRYLTIPVYQVIAADGPNYIAIAKEILANHTALSSIHYPPFYPLLIGLTNYLTNDFETAGVMVSLVMGSLLPLPVFLLGKSFLGRGAGYIAAAIVLVWPEFIGQSHYVLAFSTYFTMLFTGLWLLWHAHSNQRLLPAIFSGLFMAAAYLSRQEAFISMTAICFFLAMTTVFQDRSAKRLRPLLLAFCTFVCLSLPYIVMVHQVMGIWTLAGKSVVTLTDTLGYYLNRPDLNRDPSFGETSYMDLITKYPGYFPFIIRRNYDELLSILPVPLVIFALAGFVAGRKNSNFWTVRAFIVGALSPVVVLLAIFLISSAYIAPYLPFLFILCGHGMISIESKLTDRFRQFCPQVSRRFFFLTAITVFGYVANAAYKMIPNLPLQPPPPYTLEMDEGRYDHKVVGLMLKKLLPQGSIIMSRSGRIGFYSGFQRVDILQVDLDTILRTARENKVRFLVVDGLLLRLRPQLGKLLLPLQDNRRAGLEIFVMPEEVMPGIVPWLKYTDEESQGVVVYEIIK